MKHKLLTLIAAILIPTIVASWVILRDPEEVLRRNTSFGVAAMAQQGLGHIKGAAIPTGVGIATASLSPGQKLSLRPLARREQRSEVDVNLKRAIYYLKRAHNMLLDFLGDEKCTNPSLVSALDADLTRQIKYLVVASKNMKAFASMVIESKRELEIIYRNIAGLTDVVFSVPKPIIWEDGLLTKALKHLDKAIAALSLPEEVPVADPFPLLEDGAIVNWEMIGNVLRNDKYAVRNLLKGGPIRQPPFFIIFQPDETVNLEGGGAPVYIGPPAKLINPADVRKFDEVVDEILAGRLPLPLRYKPNRESIGAGAFRLTSSSPDEITITMAYDIGSEDHLVRNYLDELGVPGVKNNADGPGSHIARLTLNRNTQDVKKILHSLWLLVSINKEYKTYDPGTMETDMPFITIGGRAYETRHFTEGDLITGESIIEHEQSFCRIGASGEFSNVTNRGPNTRELKGPGLFLPLYRYTPYIPADKIQEFEVYVDKALHDEFKYKADRLKAGGLFIDETAEGIDEKVAGVVDLAWLVPESKGGFPIPIVTEITFRLITWDPDYPLIVRKNGICPIYGHQIFPKFISKDKLNEALSSSILRPRAREEREVKGLKPDKKEISHYSHSRTKFVELVKMVREGRYGCLKTVNIRPILGRIQQHLFDAELFSSIKRYCSAWREITTAWNLFKELKPDETDGLTYQTTVHFRELLYTLSKIRATTDYEPSIPSVLSERIKLVDQNYNNEIEELLGELEQKIGSLRLLFSKRMLSAQRKTLSARVSESEMIYTTNREILEKNRHEEKQAAIRVYYGRELAKDVTAAVPSDETLRPILSFMEAHAEIPQDSCRLATRISRQNGEVRVTNLCDPHDGSFVKALIYTTSSDYGKREVTPVIVKAGKAEYDIELEVKSKLTGRPFAIARYALWKQGQWVTSRVRTIPLSEYSNIREIISGIVRGDLPHELRVISHNAPAASGLFLEGRVIFWVLERKYMQYIKIWKEMKRPMIKIDPAPHLSQDAWVASLWEDASEIEGRPAIPVNSIILYRNGTFLRDVVYAYPPVGFWHVKGAIARVPGGPFQNRIKTQWNIYWLANGGTRVPPPDSPKMHGILDSFIYNFEGRPISIRLGKDSQGRKFHPETTLRYCVQFKSEHYVDSRGFYYHDPTTGASKKVVVYYNNQFHIPERTTDDFNINLTLALEVGRGGSRFQPEMVMRPDLNLSLDQI